MSTVVSPTRQASGIDRSPVDMFAGSWRHRDLIVQLVKRDVLGRYRGSALGVAWSLVNPVLMLAVYTFVFAVVFGSRWPGAQSESKAYFALVLFVGMIVFNIFAECLQRASGLVVSQPNFVKKVVFPLEVLPWVALGSALFHAVVSLAVLLPPLAIVLGTVHWTIVLLPVVVAPLLCLCMGLGWLLSALGVYIRDIGQMVGVAVTALMFLSPLFYPSSALPERIRWVASYNPMAAVIEQARGVVVMGQLPDPIYWCAEAAAGLAIMWLGFYCFQRMRRGFADVI